MSYLFNSVLSLTSVFEEKTTVFINLIVSCTISLVLDFDKVLCLRRRRMFLLILLIHVLSFLLLGFFFPLTSLTCRKLLFVMNSKFQSRLFGEPSHLAFLWVFLFL